MSTVLVRPAVVAGTFYPGEPEELRRWVEEALHRAGADSGEGRPPKALVVPHAGYSYSGDVAATAYARVVPAHGQVRRVVLLGPAHTVPLSCVAASGADAFATPMGRVRVDTEARDDLVRQGLVVVDDRAHAAEHSLEVQLPFIDAALGDVEVLPLVVGAVPAAEVANVLDRVWAGPETLVVVSTDLSHYHDYDTAAALDRRTASAILACRPDALAPGAACGAYPLRGLLAAASGRGLRVEMLDLRNSADAGGPPHRVVGYGSFALC